MAQAKTTEDVRAVQETSIFGAEPKPLPYLLCQMNLLLHGMEAPDIDPGNSLRFGLAEMGDLERVDVVLTNPPCGGEEEPGIQNNFPGDRRTAETALLFMQIVMRRLKRGSAYLRSVVVQHQLHSREQGFFGRERTGFRLAELNVRDLREGRVPLPSL